jgi:hypothetical protein
MRAKEGFTFYTFLNIVELVGKKAKNARELLSHLRRVEGSSIFYHTHQAFLEHPYTPSEYPHDFAYWASAALQDMVLGEKLAAININEYSNIRSLREALIHTLEEHIKESRTVYHCPEGREFYFCKSISIAIPTNYTAWNLKEFADALEKVGIYSLYYHFFIARLRLGKHTNDFSNWIRNSLGLSGLAERIEKLNPYMYTLEKLKEKIVEEVRMEDKR